MISPEDQRLLLEAVQDDEPVSGFTHTFYRYPARFSPRFARTAIELFSRRGDVVYDPFMGGGTTLVEAAVLGRRAVGTDINALGVFVAKVKTTPIPEAQLIIFENWVLETSVRLRVTTPVECEAGWSKIGYHRNIQSKDTWRIKKLIEIGVASVSALPTHELQNLGRCALLRTAQWALDCRADVPTVVEFRREFEAVANGMVVSARDYAAALPYRGRKQLPICLQRSAVGAENDTKLLGYRPAKLILTSPPYPGVHVLYHRWQVNGRRETPAPFWIANELDGNGASYYTFGDRAQKSLDKYFDSALLSFKSIAAFANSNTVVVQLVAFANPSEQLPRYLRMMNAAGFTELKLGVARSTGGRLWRTVPNRKWYAVKRGRTGSSSEVVLLHVRN